MIKKHYYVATTRYARITQITSGQINIFFKRPMILFGNKKKPIYYTTSMKT